MKPQVILAKLDGDYQVELQVEDYHPFEPSAYVWDSGWSCNDGEKDYYVSESGDVYEGKKLVGVAPAVKEMADARV